MEVIIESTFGKVRVPADYAVDGLVIHSKFLGKGNEQMFSPTDYTLTHVPSGKALCYSQSRDNLQILAVKLSQLASWTAPDGCSPPELGPIVAQLITSYHAAGLVNSAVLSDQSLDQSDQSPDREATDRRGGSHGS